MTPYLFYAKLIFNGSSERGGDTIPSRSFNPTCLPLSLLTSLSLPLSLALNYLAALSVFIYLSKVHVQYACTNFLLGEQESSSAERGG